MQISEAQGWRLQLDPARRPYCALIGGHGWACELNRDELCSLRQAVLTLLAQRRQLQDCLMPEEELDLDLDLSLQAGSGEGRGSLFVALSGNSQHWSLRFVLTPGDGSRAAEGGWTAEASPPLAAALEGLGDGIAESI